MKRFTLLLIGSLLIVNCSFALMEAPEQYRIKTSSEKVEKAVKKAPSIPTFNETIVEVQEEVLPQEKSVPEASSGVLSVIAKIITIALIVAIFVLGILTLLNRKKT